MKKLIIYSFAGFPGYSLEEFLRKKEMARLLERATSKPT
jgi:hypothetical protein